jgi:hypothetical protein
MEGKTKEFRNGSQQAEKRCELESSNGPTSRVEEKKKQDSPKAPSK